MRFVWAVVAFVLAAVMIGAGIAQRTVFTGPKAESQAIEVAGTAPYVLIDGAVLNSHAGSQTLRVEDPGTIFAAYGRTADIKAWLAPADYVQVSLDHGRVASTAVAAAEPLPAGAEPIAPSGSDLWLQEFQAEGVLSTPLQLPADMSLLVATDGVQAAPSIMSLTWPVRALTPWSGPLIVGGCLLLVIGLVLYFLGVRHVRRSRGPRRKGLPMPSTEPIDLSEKNEAKGVITAAPTRRSLAAGRRSLVAAPAALLAAVLFTGCSADAWPQLGGSPTPAASSTVVTPETQGAPAVTKAQAEVIVERIAQQVADADKSQDADAAALRLSGTALATRTTNYKLEKAIKDQPAMAPIPSGKLRVILPEALDGWPRTFLAVAAGAGGAADTVMSVVQQDPWSPYKVSYLADLVGDVRLNLAPDYVGAVSIDPDSPFLTLAPNELAAAYADVLTNGEDSRFAGSFDLENDAFAKQVAADRTKRLKQFNETGAKTGKMTFAARAGATAPVALATLDSGAIVAVSVDESDTVKPTDEDAVIKLPDNPVVKTLADVTQSATGFTTTFADQLFFFVPAQSSSDRIQLLGYSSDILDAKVAKK